MSAFSGFFRLGGASSWQRAVTQAEKLVGYPTSFMSLRHLLSDEAAQVAVQLRKLVGSKHPLLQTARGLLGDQKRGSQTRGLVVLLLAKAAAPPSVGILPQHRSLAEIVETIHTAAIIHRGIVDRRAEDIVFGNRLATLSGDFLLASASTGLADLHNRRVVEWVSAAIGDIVEAEFSPMAVAGDRLENERLDSNAENLTAVCRGLSPADWDRYVGLGRGSLLSACARSAVLLADQPLAMQEAASEFAQHWARLHCLVEELALLQVDNGNGNGLGASTEDSYGLCPRPSLAHVFLAETGESPPSRLTEDSLAWQKCWQKVEELAEKAQDSLKGGAFPGSEGLSALNRLVDTLVLR